MARVQKSLRFDSDLAAAVSSLSREGESEAATYGRVLAAGVEALKAGDQDGMETERPAGDGAAAIAFLQAHVTTLQETNDVYRSQLEMKDDQIRALSVLAGQAQELQGRTAKAIDTGDTETRSKRGWWSRLFGRDQDREAQE